MTLILLLQNEYSGAIITMAAYLYNRLDQYFQFVHSYLGIVLKIGDPVTFQSPVEEKSSNYTPERIQ